MVKKIFSYGFVEGIARGLNKVTLLLLPLFISQVDLGKIGILISIEVLVILISFLGLEKAVLRFYSEKESFPNFLESISLPIKISHLFIVLLLFLFYFLKGDLLFGVPIFPDIFLVILLVYVQGVNTINLNVFRVEENHAAYFKNRILLQVLKFVLAVGLVFFFKNYLGYVIGSIIATIVATVVSQIELKKHYLFQKTFNKKTFNTLFAFSWPFIFYGISSNLIGNADKFIIEKFMTMKDVGDYTFAYSLGTTITFAFYGVTVYFEPLFYKQKSEKRREEILNKFLIYTQLTAIIFYCVIYILCQYVLPKIYKQDFELVYKIIPLISISHIFYCFYLSGNYKLVYMQKSKSIAFLSFISCIVNVGLNYLLIPVYGIFGAVIVCFVSAASQAFVTELYSNKFRFNINLLFIFIFSIFISFTLFFKFNFIINLLFLTLYMFFFYVFKRNIYNRNE